jgi:hypothetical protein
MPADIMTPTRSRQKSQTRDNKFIISPWLLNFSTILKRAIIEMDVENLLSSENLDNLML